MHNKYILTPTLSKWFAITAVTCCIISNETCFLLFTDLWWDILDYFDGSNDAFKNNTMLQFEHYQPVPHEGIHYNLPILHGVNNIPPECDGLMVHIGPNPKYWRRSKHNDKQRSNTLPLSFLTDSDRSSSMSSKDDEDDVVNYNLGKHHWFDGDGMIHIIQMNPENQTVDYSNAWLMTPKLEIETRLQRSVYFSLAGNMIDNGFWGIFKGLWFLFVALLPISPFKLDSIFKVGPANTAVLKFDDKLYALTENSFPFEFMIDESLLSIESKDYRQVHECWDVPLSAHPKFDSNTNELLAFGYNVMYSHVSIGIINQGLAHFLFLLFFLSVCLFVSLFVYFGLLLFNPKINTHVFFYILYIETQTLHGANIGLNHAQLMHDMAMTSDYLIILDTNLWAGPDILLKHGTIMKYEQNHNSRIGFVRRTDLLSTKPVTIQNGRFMSNIKIDDTDNVPIIWIDIKPCMIMHSGAAWHDDKNPNIVTFISPRITHPDFVSTFQHSNKINLKLDNNHNLSVIAPGLPHLYQWKFDLSKGILISERQLLNNDVFAEFPIIHEKRLGIKPDTIFMAKMGVNVNVEITENRNKHKNKKSNQNLNDSSVVSDSGETSTVGGYLGAVSIIKYNVNDESFEELSFGNNRVATGETIFIGKDKTGKDDSNGYLANILFNYQTKQTTFEIFNSTTMDPKPIFVAQLPYRVPAGFHSHFINRFNFKQLES